MSTETNAASLAERLSECLSDLADAHKDYAEKAATCEYDASYFCHNEAVKIERCRDRLADALTDLKAWCKEP